MRNGFKADLLGVFLLLLVAIALGLSCNLLRHHPLSLFKPGGLSSGKTQFASLGLEEFKAFVFEKKGLVLDSRPESVYRAGHVPGALSLPRENFEAGYAKIRDRLESDKSRPLVVYCNLRSCRDSEEVAQKLVLKKHSNVRLFKGGWVVWMQLGLPKERE